MEPNKMASLGDYEENDLATSTMALVDRIRPHIGTILLVVLTLFAALAGWTLIGSQRSSQQVAGWDECLAAMAEGDPGRLEDVVARYDGTPAAAWAEIVLADTALADGNRLFMVDPTRGRRRLEEAADRYMSVNARRPAALAAERGIFGLARARESLGELNEARRGYEALVAEHPQSPFKKLAEERIAALSRDSTARWYNWFESRSAPAAPAEGTQAEPAPESTSEPKSETPEADEPAKPATEPATEPPAG